MPVADAPDAVDWPLISAWTDALNDALMPAKLFKKRQRESIREGMRTHMNMASAGDEPFVYDSELKRMKLTGKVNLSDSGLERIGMDAYYSLPLGSTVASGVNVIADTVDTLTYVASIWRSVWRNF